MSGITQREVSESGFTLAETLVVIALLSLLTAALFGAVRFGLSVWGSVSQRGAAETQVAVVQDFLRRVIGGAYPAFVSHGSGRGHLEFAGEQSSMTFIGPAPMSREIGGRSRITLSLETTNQSKALVVSSHPELQNPIQDASRDVLLQDVQSVEFSYFGKSSAGVLDWQKTWNNAFTMPRSIRIRVNFVHGDRRSWSDLIISPRVDVDVTCAYDLLTKRCRGR